VTALSPHPRRFFILFALSRHQTQCYLWDTAAYFSPAARKAAVVIIGTNVITALLMLASVMVPPHLTIPMWVMSVVVNLAVLIMPLPTAVSTVPAERCAPLFPPPPHRQTVKECFFNTTKMNCLGEGVGGECPDHPQGCPSHSNNHF
jgi:hypothetical protein